MRDRSQIYGHCFYLQQSFMVKLTNVEFEAYVLICAEDLFNFTAEIKVQTHLMNNSIE